MQGLCEAGESQCIADCGPWDLSTPSFPSFYTPNGVMFSVTSVVDIYLSGLFVTHMAGNPTIALYTTPNGFQGKESNQGDWTQIGSGAFSSVQNSFSVGFNSFDPIKLDAGSTRGFYFASTGTLRAYISDVSPIASDSRLQINSPGVILGSLFSPYPNVGTTL